MPSIPAFCDVCHSVFPSGVSCNDLARVAIYDCNAGNCPKCGGRLIIHDGVYQAFNEAIQIIDAPNKTYEQITKYFNLIKEAKDQGVSNQSITKKIEEEAPELFNLISLLPHNRSELYAFLALLLSFFTLFMDNKEQSTTNNITININHVASEVIKSGNSEKPKNNPQPNFSTPSRNEPCPCGSELKYKNCCGEII
ncbi:SEC-C metal-binding domain-containing protein [Providencia sp. PROV024]|uniref:SEC-C metal-binding domain-containing protein n=1 Tax=Providencia sp. PROV024 TaxID=2949758 RepID=UPI002349AFCC|nr:SEC-C metal-binding domain-containing protein [Providencia sp. PROV024]WOC02878.1 SEC-C metal-binding domain-containing protein [Providencia sp. PROV024]